jgi:PadR family transcriptional regulator, regulatory protein AphA
MSTTNRDDLTPTSYAMLGLLALRPWTTYELAKQMQRSVHWFWPRAERKLYDEPKRLAALGLAVATPVMTGRRASSVYEITGDGREALRSWLAGPDAAAPLVEIETLLRVFFADGAGTAVLTANIARLRSDAEVALAGLGIMAAGSAVGDDAFPERRATNALSMELIVRLHEAMRDWADWADAEVATWPSARRGRREVAVGPVERGNDLFAAIAARTVSRE